MHLMHSPETTPYAPVRALSRGLGLLQALSRLGPAGPAQLAAATGIDRTTTYRLLETLRAGGFVSRSENDNVYALTAAVRQLGDGFTDRDLIGQTVAPELGQLLTEVKWPSDFAVFEAGRMVIRESTHRFSHFSPFRAMIGRAHGLTGSALGRAALAAATPGERRHMLDLATTEAGEPPLAPGHAEALCAEVAARGYAQSVDGAEKGISAIALPVRGPTRALCALNIVFYTSAMRPQEAARRHLAALAATVARIEARLGAARPGPAG